MKPQGFDLVPSRSSAVQLSLALWGAVLVLTTGLGLLNGSVPSRSDIISQLMGFAGAVGTSAVLYLTLRRVRGWPRIGAYAILTAAVPVLAGVEALIAYASDHLIAQLSDGTQAPELAAALRVFFPLLVCFGLNLCLFLISALSQRSRDEQRQLFDARVRAAQAEAEAARSELAALHYQLNPHFLLNSLNAVSSLIMEGRHEHADETVLRLAGFLRDVLKTNPTAKVELTDELARTERYLDIQRVRFAGRFSTEIDCPEQLARALVPSLILQPLVENAVKYAVTPSGDAVRLSVRARVVDGQLLLTVEDDGPGGAVEEGTGIGIANVRSKLESYYGDAAACELVPKERGFRVDLQLPLERLPEAEPTTLHCP